MRWIDGLMAVEGTYVLLSADASSFMEIGIRLVGRHLVPLTTLTTSSSGSESRGRISSLIDLAGAGIEGCTSGGIFIVLSPHGLRCGGRAVAVLVVQEKDAIATIGTLSCPFVLGAEEC